MVVTYFAGTQSIIAYATVHGYLCGWDLRQPKQKHAWKFKNDAKLGKVKSLPSGKNVFYGENSFLQLKKRSK